MATERALERLRLPQNFTVTSDGHGGTLITDPPVVSGGSAATNTEISSGGGGTTNVASALISCWGLRVGLGRRAGNVARPAALSTIAGGGLLASGLLKDQSPRTRQGFSR
jgi:hypothetical protein